MTISSGAYNNISDINIRCLITTSKFRLYVMFVYCSESLLFDDDNWFDLYEKYISELDILVSDNNWSEIKTFEEKVLNKLIDISKARNVQYVTYKLEYFLKGSKDKSCKSEVTITCNFMNRFFSLDELLESGELKPYPIKQ